MYNFNVHLSIWRKHALSPGSSLCPGTNFLKELSMTTQYCFANKSEIISCPCSTLLNMQITDHEFKAHKHALLFLYSNMVYTLVQFKYKHLCKENVYLFTRDLITLREMIWTKVKNTVAIKIFHFNRLDLHTWGFSNKSFQHIWIPFPIKFQISFCSYFSKMLPSNLHNKFFCFALKMKRRKHKMATAFFHFTFTPARYKKKHRIYIYFFF